MSMADDIADLSPLWEAEQERREEQRELVEIPFVRIARESDKAFYFVFDEDNPIFHVRHWLPKSQVVVMDARFVVCVPKWLVEEKELEEYGI